MKTIPLFKNEYGFLSNFHISPLVWDGFCWNTVEHAFQAAKAKFSTDSWLIRIAKTPAIARRRGRAVILREDWEQIKVSVMTELVWLKFEQNPDLRDKLLATSSVELIEGNYWHDNFWGDCYCRKCMKHEGKNMLGFILMGVRTEIALLNSPNLKDILLGPPRLEMTKEQKMREAVFFYIEAKKSLTSCMQQHFRQVCHKCKKYSKCLVYDGYVEAWINLQNSYYIEPDESQIESTESTES